MTKQSQSWSLIKTDVTSKNNQYFLWKYYYKPNLFIL